MPAWTLSYSVGNEHNPANPWGRSELVIGPDGFARLDHYFSRKPGSGAWTGQVDAAALATLWAVLGSPTCLSFGRCQTRPCAS